MRARALPKAALPAAGGDLRNAQGGRAPLGFPQKLIASPPTNQNEPKSQKMSAYRCAALTFGQNSAIISLMWIFMVYFVMWTNSQK